MIAIVVRMIVFMLMSMAYAPARNVNMKFNTWVIFTVRCKIHDCRERGRFLRAKWYRSLLKRYVRIMNWRRL